MMSGSRAQSEQSELAAADEEGNEERKLPKAASFNAKQTSLDENVEVQIKFVDYVPPPLRNSFKTVDADNFFQIDREKTDFSDPVADNELDDARASGIGENDSGSLSEIKQPPLVAQMSRDSSGSLLRMTTSRQIFSAYYANIGT